ncbi:MAG: hypothetical protein COV69_02800 [Parcubacteria group bacterium CG11_big_fil_rev_8_21_14_0_20_39_14]|nr:MAG: hypothetical protein COV69_02800 [Parcubacteria group bacterium CG11_big_fil_rev_8_21_14_0_20_39_14]PIS35199.1 MAG: hypothetical protein COT36_03655 [Parcubacteria group bacterium CG08_land_8_20_14_0_20_38_56]
MNPEFEDCLKRNKIKPFSRGKNLVSKELKSAKSDLEIAKESFEKAHYKWATIQCYYSMFHATRALIYAENYREKSHHCLLVALRALYVETRRLNFKFLENLERAKTLRENADYYGDFSQIGAKDILDKAKEFLEKTKGILSSREKEK